MQQSRKRCLTVLLAGDSFVFWEDVYLGKGLIWECGIWMYSCSQSRIVGFRSFLWKHRINSHDFNSDVLPLQKQSCLF